MFSATRTAYTFNGMQPWPESLQQSANLAPTFPANPQMARSARRSSVNWQQRCVRPLSATPGEPRSGESHARESHAREPRNQQRLSAVGRNQANNRRWLRRPLASRGSRTTTPGHRPAVQHRESYRQRPALQTQAAYSCTSTQIRLASLQLDSNPRVRQRQHPSVVDREQGNRALRPPSFKSRNQTTTPGHHPVDQRRPPYHPCPPLPAYPLPTYYDSAEVLVQSLLRRKNKHITGEILYVTPHGANCLGFFPLPDCPQIPIKFCFRLNRAHRSFLTRRGAREYYIEGQLQLNLTKLRRYIFHHPPGSFLSLDGQTAQLSEIPISVESSAIRHKATNVTVLTRELTEIVGYLNSLGRTIVEGEVLFWAKNTSCRAVHKFEDKNRYIKFLFDIPKPQRGLSIVELQHSFTTVRCRLSFDKKGLTRYVAETGLGGFRSSRVNKKAIIAIRGKDVQLVVIDSETSSPVSSRTSSPELSA